MSEVQPEELERLVQLWLASARRFQELMGVRRSEVPATEDDLPDASGSLHLATIMLAHDAQYFDWKFDPAPLWRALECAQLWTEDRSKRWLVGFGVAVNASQEALDVMALRAGDHPDDGQPTSTKKAHVDDGVGKFLYRAVMAGRQWGQARSDAVQAGYRKLASDQAASNLVDRWCRRNNVDPKHKRR